VLRLASLSRRKPLHYVSTLAVFSLIDHFELNVVRESDLPRHHEALFSGYPQSKWVAEQLVLRAQDRGLPAVIYRPGVITGHSRTGVSRLTDFVFREVLGCLQVGAAADKDYPVDMTPVDYVAEAIVALSQDPQSIGKAFHLVNDPVQWHDVVQWIKASGYQLELLPHETWRRRVLSDPGFSSSPLYELVSLYPELPESARLSVPELRFDTTRTAAALARFGVSCARSDQRLMETYLRFAVQGGRVAPPSHVRETESVASGAD
jgi:thioester reductase-like protein